MVSLTAVEDYPADQQLEKLKELVFSLPEHNKNVLLALLEVISKIIKHSGTNKMTSQNLATCLAPVLMKHNDISVALMSVHKSNSIVEFMFRHWLVLFFFFSRYMHKSSLILLLLQ